MSNEASQAEFARMQGWSRSHITGLKQAGRMVMSEDGKKVLVQESLARIKSTQGKARDDVSDRWEKERSGDAPSPTPETPQDQLAIESKQQSIAKSEHFKSLKLEAEYRVMAGELVEVNQVEKAWVDGWTHLRASMDNLQDRLSSELACENDPERIYALLGEHFELTLNEVSRKLTQATEAKA